MRSSITATRYRLPDACVLKTAPATRYLLDAAFLVIEVLSEGDVMSSVIEKLREYASKGVENIWLIDPRLRGLHVYRALALSEVSGERISTSDGLLELSRSEIFGE